MKNVVDFLNFLHHDLLIKILTSLEDPSDLVRFSVISHSWRRFGGTSKGHVEAGSSNFMEWEALEREHRVYAFLAQGCLSFAVRGCISEAIIASSTDIYPEESIDNTLEPRDRVAQRASYWSSKGQSNPAVPETLTYELVSDLCVITEINIRPFQAKSVRFRMGHLYSSTDNLVDDSCQDSGNDKFVWTYTSQEFPMVQENRLQNFKLPEPILCIGGILQIELLGRVQRQEMDGLFYICVAHVQVVGRPLSPAFGIQILEPSEKFVLEALSYTQPTLPEQTSSVSSLQMRVRRGEQIVNLLQGNVVDLLEYGYGWDDLLEEESDEEEEIIHRE